MVCIILYQQEEECRIYMVNFVVKVRVSPLRPRCVLANGVATVFSAPARIMTKKECLVDSKTIKGKNHIANHQKNKCSDSE